MAKIIFVFLMILIILILPFWAFYASSFTVVLTVKEKWIKQASWSDSGQKYLFSDTKGNVYEITDQILLLRFDASNRWAILDEGKTYRITFYGWRVPFFSWYPNAIDIVEVSK